MSVQRGTIFSFSISGFGVLLEALSGSWDVYSHRIVFVEEDPWWNPAHLLLYGGALTVFASIVLPQLRKGRNGTSPILTRARLILLTGASLQVLGGFWNEIQHRVLESEPVLSPAHAVFTVGMLLTGVGAVTGLSLLKAAGPISNANWRIRGLLACASASSFSSVWIISAGSMIYTALAFPTDSVRFVSLTALLLISPLVLIAALRTWGGSMAIVTTVLYALTNFLFVVGYARATLYLPWGATIGVLTTILWLWPGSLPNQYRAALVGGMAGLFAHFLHFPFSSFAFQTSWPPTAIQAVTFLVLGSVGGLLGYVIVDAIGWVVAGQTLRRRALKGVWFE